MLGASPKVFLYSMIAAVIWGLAPLADRSGLSRVDPLVGLTIRASVAALCLLVMAMVTVGMRPSFCSRATIWRSMRSSFWIPDAVVFMWASSASLRCTPRKGRQAKLLLICQKHRLGNRPALVGSQPIEADWRPDRMAGGAEGLGDRFRSQRCPQPCSAGQSRKKMVHPELWQGKGAENRSSIYG